jgi:hypothetical protein
VTVRCIPLVTAACGTRVARRARTTTFARGGDGSQLGPRVSSVLDDHLLVGKLPKVARQLWPSWQVLRLNRQTDAMHAPASQLWAAD